MLGNIFGNEDDGWNVIAIVIAVLVVAFIAYWCCVEAPKIANELQKNFADWVGEVFNLNSLLDKLWEVPGR